MGRKRLAGRFSILVFFLAAALLVAAVALWPQGTAAGPQSVHTDSPDFPSILRAHARNLSSVTSDAEALALYSSHLGPALDLQDSVAALTNKPPTGNASSDSAMKSELTSSAVRLTAELAAWRLATAIKQGADADEAAAIHAVLQQATIQRSWLLEGEGRPYLRQAVALSAVLTSVQTPQTSEPDASSQYGEYAAYLDRTYSGLTETDTSWVAVAERDGSSGLRRRLMEFFENTARSDVDKEAFASRYFRTRVRPVLTAQLIAGAIRAEAEAEQTTRGEWTRLRAWRETLKEKKGLARLCGTWQWTVHNHKNHQEHKTIIAFPPPDVAEAPPSSGTRPSKIVVLGDVVYLRWDFQGGYQEDSLLFTREGRHLEGSFINSAGAWGSITGKRAAPCPASNAK